MVALPSFFGVTTPPDTAATFLLEVLHLKPVLASPGATATGVRVIGSPLLTVIVPVTRMVYSKPDINTAVMELANGPSREDMLESVVPAGCGLIDVNVENGVAKLNFTGEFVNRVQNSDGGRMALKALVLTCTQFDGIDAVEIYVDGRKYEADGGELSVPSFMNVADSIVYDYIQTQSAMLFDFE